MAPYYDQQVGRFARPDPLRDHDVILARVRRARAEATRQALTAIYRSLKSAATLREFRHRRPARLTAGCN